MCPPAHPNPMEIRLSAMPLPPHHPLLPMRCERPLPTPTAVHRTADKTRNALQSYVPEFAPYSVLAPAGGKRPALPGTLAKPWNHAH